MGLYFVAAVSCQAWNQAEDKLLLGCKDKSLVSYTVKVA